MRIKDLKNQLDIFPEDMEVLVQSTPSDFCEPINRKHLSVSLASYEDKHGLEQSKLVITAFIPQDSNQ